MSALDIDAIEARAQAIDWMTLHTRWGADGHQVTAGDGHWLLVATTSAPESDAAIAEYIASMDPITTLALVGEVRRLRRVEALMFRHYTGSPGFEKTPEHVREIDALADLYDDELAADLRAALTDGAA